MFVEIKNNNKCLKHIIKSRSVNNEFRQSKSNLTETDCTYDDDFVSCNNHSVFQTNDPSYKSKPPNFKDHSTSSLNNCETSNESIIDSIILNRLSATELEKNSHFEENALITHDQVSNLSFNHTFLIYVNPGNLPIASHNISYFYRINIH